VREALLAPGGGSGSAGCGTEFFGGDVAMRGRKSSAPHGAELQPPSAAAERAALRGLRPHSGSAGCGTEFFGWDVAARGRKSSAPHGAELQPPSAAAERAALRQQRLEAYLTFDN
jgi:hypothetical protein